MRKGSTSIFLIGGGPSIRSIDLNALRYAETCCINMSVWDVPHPSFFLTKDYSFISRIPRYIASAPKSRQNKMLEVWKQVYKVFVVATGSGELSVQDGIVKDTRFNWTYDLGAMDEVIYSDSQYGISYNPPDFCSGVDSGYSALQYVVWNGKYTDIYLVGYDFTTSIYSHYHDKYPPVNLKAYQTKLDGYRRFYEEVLAKITRDTGIRIYSCSSISKLNDIIPYVDIRNLV